VSEGGADWREQAEIKVKVKVKVKIKVEPREMSRGRPMYRPEPRKNGIDWNIGCLPRGMSPDLSGHFTEEVEWVRKRSDIYFLIRWNIIGEFIKYIFFR
jgi:hypothetical protein